MPTSWGPDRRCGGGWKPTGRCWRHSPIHSDPMRTLALIDSAGRRDPVEIRRMEAADLHPRVLLFEDRLGAQMLDRSYLRTLPRARRRLAKLLPGPFAQVVAAYGMRGGY